MRFPSLQVATGRVAWRQGQYDQALTAFESAAESGQAEAVSCVARALASLGHVDHAIERLRPFATRNPECAFLFVMFSLESRTLDHNRQRFEDLLLRWPQLAYAALAIHAIDSLAGSPAPPPRGGARIQAIIESAEWLVRHGGGRVFGTAVRLLNFALDACPKRGQVLEFGVYHGRSIKQIAQRTQRPVHGFDSFQGLPEDWKPGEGAGAYSTDGRLPSVPENVSLHRGWFVDSVAPFLRDTGQKVAFAHIDCDLYSSTRTVLDAIDNYLVPGSVLLFDDLLGYPGHADHELRALREWSATSGLRWHVLGHVLLGREVAVQLS